jgi:peptidoglycan hydrolase-like protein with peptidoglycan-binding domain
LLAIRTLLFAAALLLVLPQAPCAEPKKTPPKKSTSTAKKSTAKKTVSSSKKSASNPQKKVGTARKQPVGKKSAHGRASTVSTRRQQAPSSDRYREIQKALVDRGFLKSEPNGVWGAESSEAMRKFQEANNLKASGKVDSLSLIALGLGPKRTVAVKAPQPDEKPQQP